MTGCARIATLIVLLAACNEDSGPPSQLVELGKLTFEVPLDWKRTDGIRPGTLTAAWTPPKNDRQESVTVVRTHRSGPPSGNAAASTQQLLVSAQRSLRDAKIASLSPVTTMRGLSGSRVDVRFKPNGVERAYRRVHVVLVENEHTLIHVLYTAANPDKDLTALHLVLDTIKSSGDPS